MARFVVGKDCWVCSCGAVVAIGRICGCGRTYADVLAKKYHPTAERKVRPAAGKGKFVESYCFKKKGEK